MTKTNKISQHASGTPLVYGGLSKPSHNKVHRKILRAHKTMSISKVRKRWEKKLQNKGKEDRKRRMGN